MKFARVLVPTVAVGALLLAGCTASGPTQDAAGADCLASGAASQSIQVEGDLGAMPAVTSETPVRTDTAERSVLTEGAGDVVADGDTMTFSYSMINGATGEVLELPDATGETVPAFAEDLEVPFDSAQFAGDPLLVALGDLLRCATEGQRAVAVVPLADILQGQEPEAQGLTDMTAEDSLVIVADTVKIERGSGEAAGPEAATVCEALEPRDEKYPEVDLGDGNSEPVITIPECIEPPTELEIKVLEEGDGAVVEENQKVMTNYVGVDWNGGVRFDGNWSETGIEFSTESGALIPGFTEAMVGQKVGSTVLVTMPPELGYDDGMTRTFVLQLVEIVE